MIRSIDEANNIGEASTSNQVYEVGVSEQVQRQRHHACKLFQDDVECVRTGEETEVP